MDFHVCVTAGDDTHDCKVVTPFGDNRVIVSKGAAADNCSHDREGDCYLCTFHVNSTTHETYAGGPICYLLLGSLEEEWGIPVGTTDKTFHS